LGISPAAQSSRADFAADIRTGRRIDVSIARATISRTLAPPNGLVRFQRSCGDPSGTELHFVRRSISISQLLDTTAPASQVPEHTSAQQRSLEQACLCASVADDLRGQDTVVLDLTAVTPIVDFFVITTATSGRQMRAVAEAVGHTLKGSGAKRIGKEGVDSSLWILLDYGDIVLHVFSPEARTQYDLEHLWADAPHVDWKSRLRNDE
jgi:ribosome-associated protein